MTESQKYWQQVHRQYDKQPWSNQPSIFAQQITPYLPDSGNLLELAAGIGNDSIYFANRFQVTSTDLETTKLHTKTSQLPPNLQTKIQIATIDLEKPFPFSKGTFDIVYCHLGLHYFSKTVTKRIIKSISEVLTKNGLLALLLNSTNDPEYQIAQGTSTEIEPDYFQYGDVAKRYFSVESLTPFVTPYFDTLLSDNHGTTHKDNKIGVSHLVRYVGRKNKS